MQLLILDGHIRLRFRFGHEDEGGLVPILAQRAVHAGERRLDLPTHEPFPKRRVAGIEEGVICLEPVQHTGICCPGTSHITPSSIPATRRSGNGSWVARSMRRTT